MTIDHLGTKSYLSFFFNKSQYGIIFQQNFFLESQFGRKIIHRDLKEIPIFVYSILLLSSHAIHCVTLTSVCRMAARCSLAVRDSLSTSTCCLLSENWLVSVSSLVCRPKSSVSFRDRSCFTWSICARQTVSLNVWKTLQKTPSSQTSKLKQRNRMKPVVSGLMWEQKWNFVIIPSVKPHLRQIKLANSLN